MVKYKLEKIVDSNDWDDLVVKTYGKPYCFQQQDDCKSRGVFKFEVPYDSFEWEGVNETITEVVNGEEMCVKFASWLNTDPEEHKKRNNWEDYELRLFWDRNFYPPFGSLVDDLHAKGLIESGEYTMNIDW